MAENQSTVENAKEKLDRWLKDGITTPGGKLPSERELGELLGIKRMTLRQALLNLEAESKIFRKDRKGWFVTQPRFNYSPELSASFQRAAIEQGREPSWGFTEKNRTSDIPETLAPLIAVTPSTELYRITGWGALEGHKVFYHETYINPEVAPGFIEQLENHSFSPPDVQTCNAVRVWLRYHRSNHGTPPDFSPGPVSAWYYAHSRKYPYGPNAWFHR